MLATELEGLLNAHAFMRVERPPELWAPQGELEPFVRLLGEMRVVPWGRPLFYPSGSCRTEACAPSAR
jgi:hypothetical protein